MATRMQVRRDMAANWTAASPVLRVGEWALETDTGRVKVGDGATAWTSLPYLPKLPTSATDNTVPRFDGATGRILQTSGVVVDDSNNVSGVGTLASGAQTVTGSVTASTSVQAAAGSGFVVGASGPKILSGTGSPEGVVTAPVGSAWIDTAATTGAVQWVKAGGTGNTGWKVAVGNTGLRSGLAAQNGWTRSGMTIQRTGDYVELITSVLNGAAASSGVFYTAPAGFKPVSLNTYYVAGGGTGAPTHSWFNNAGALTMSGTYTQVSAARVTATWLTADPWPTVLP